MAGLDCGGKCMKALLFIFNGLFFLAGAAMLGLGIWLMVDPSIAARFTHIAVGSGGLFKAAAITIIVVGSLILLIGFFGCCGAIKESPCMLCTFVGLLTLILVLEIVVAILAGVFRKELGEGLRDTMSKQAQTEVQPIKKDDNTAVSFAWHQMQYDLKCCGGRGPIDYKNNTNFKGTGTPVPKTCCLLKTDDVKNAVPIDYPKCKNEFLTSVSDPKQLMNVSCYDSFTDWIKNKSAILIGVALGIAAVEILGIIFACCLRNQVNRKKEYV